jgi:putative thioesterase YiiD
MSGARQIQELLHSKIPITRAMGVKVEDYDGRRLILSAPLDANVNHLGTAFGGSLNALAVLSGYGLLGSVSKIAFRVSSPPHALSVPFFRSVHET